MVCSPFAAYGCSPPLIPTKVEHVTDAPYLAELSESNPATGAGECLSVFLIADETPAGCLTDPEVVGDDPAPGHWRLLGVDGPRRRAYYTRMAHSGRFGCGSRPRVRGTYIYPPIS
jgi:hypothetical protein